MLRQQIEQELKEALKKGQQLRLSTLRFLLAAIQNEEIAKQREATDEDVVTVVQRQIKQRKESIEAYSKGNRPELAEKEKQESEIISKFLPQQMTEDEIRRIVEEMVASLPESEKKNFGKVMGMVMGRVKGKVDGNKVGQVVKSILSQ